MPDSDHQSPQPDNETRELQCHLCNECDPDVTIRSSDGVLFRASSKNLAFQSDVFPPMDFITAQEEGEVVELAETATIIRLMLQYMHPMEQPDVLNLPPSNVIDLAEAVEKYRIFSAMYICKYAMKTLIPIFPMSVLLYAAKHRFKDIMEELSESIVDASPQKMQNILEDFPDVLLAWLLYREQCRRLIADIKNKPKPPPYLQHKGGSTYCDEWVQERTDFRNGLLEEESLCPIKLRGHSEKAFQKLSCQWCQKAKIDFRHDVDVMIRKLPTFSSLLKW